MENKDLDILGFLNIVEGIDGVSIPPKERERLEKVAFELECFDLRDKLLNWLDSLDAKEEEEELPSLPEKAPELYIERTDKLENCVTFFFRVYGPWLDKGAVIYQDNLSGKNNPLDKKLLANIRSLCGRSHLIEIKLQGEKFRLLEEQINNCEDIGEKVRLIVPPKKERLSKEIRKLEKSGISASELKRLGTVLHKRDTV